jgi:ADP-heptose:LPS heptosyltransferase
MSVYKATLVPYQLSASSKVLTCDYHRLVSHSKNNLTIKSYSKCIRNFNGEYFSKSLIISREKVFDEYSFANKKYAGVVLTSGSNWKNIPPIEWSWVFHTLTELDFEIVVIGTDSDGDILKKIVSNSQKNVTNLINRIPLADLPALISKFLVLIGSDTGPIYIADSIGVPTVVYAGPCHMTEQCPVGETFIVESTVEPKNKSYVFDTLKSGDFTDHYITNKNVRRDIFQFLANL